MINKTLTASFQQAVDNVNSQGYVDGYQRAGQMLVANFVACYKTADADEDQKTKKVLVEGLSNFALEQANRNPPNVNAANAFVESVLLACSTLRDNVEDKSLIPQGFAAQLFKATRQLVAVGGNQYNAATVKSAASIAAAGYDVSEKTQDTAAALADVIIDLANIPPRDINHSNALTDAVQLLSGQIKSQAPQNFETRLLVAALKLSGKTGDLQYCDALIKNTQKMAQIAHQFHQPPTQGQPGSAAVSNFLTGTLQGAIELVGKQSDVDAYSLTLRMLNNNFSITYQFALSQDDQTRKDLVQKMADFIVEQANRPPASATAAAVISDGVQLLSATLKEQVTDKSLIPYDFTTRLLEAAEKMSRGGNKESAEKISTAARQLVTRPKATEYPTL